MAKWEKPPADLIEFLKTILQGLDCEVRNMFGVPTGFIKGNMFLGAHQRSLILRLSQVDIEDTVTKHHGVRQFEPMQGHVMKEYVSIPEEIYNNRAIFDELLKKSIVYVSSLPMKGRKK